MIALGEGFQPLALFHDKHLTNIIFQHYSLDIKNHFLILHTKK
jgi:hypothetical protein